MTTIVDPGGSPVVVYSDATTTIAEIVASGTTGAAAAEIARFAQTTVVVATNATDETGLKLTSDFLVGDVLEIYATDTGSNFLKLYDAGESLFLNGFARAVIRRVASSGSTSEQWKASVLA